MKSASTTKRRRRIKYTVFLGLAGIILVLGLVQLARPLLHLRTNGDRLAQLRLTKAALEADEATLSEQKAFLATGTGQEITARRQGYIRPGERRLVFCEEKLQEPAAGDAETAED
ncbi:MAG: hypothetical protein JXA57_07250 [Armatimonadetes bacterium]|nr:hypothetical protein [Armatimonadota bacterium]